MRRSRPAAGPCLSGRLMPSVARGACEDHRLASGDPLAQRQALREGLIHKDRGSAYGVTFPDFPGCFSAADDLADLPRLAQEAVEVNFEGEDMGIPAPTSPDAWLHDERFQDGYWMLINIDLSKISTRAVRLNISLPENLVHRIDAMAKAQRLSRSAFLAKAAEREMAKA
ncbi:type II toxin-antitoxin system HicB family antitoxin [Castellaniella sp.]|uniref:type II toxin-antitoxin system HicB family antitoxin n=2 Tax=Castellaniella sp. TaxID=1955812 RepID=UPI0035673BA2